MKEKDLVALIAEGIRRCRTGQALTIERLAEQAGVDASYLAHIEVKTKTPSLKVLAKIIDGLGVSAEQVFWGPPIKSDKLGRRLLTVLRGVGPRQQAEMLAILMKLRDRRQLAALKTLLRA